MDTLRSSQCFQTGWQCLGTGTHFTVHLLAMCLGREPLSILPLCNTVWAWRSLRSCPGPGPWVDEKSGRNRSMVFGQMLHISGSTCVLKTLIFVSSFPIYWKSRDYCSRGKGREPGHGSGTPAFRSLQPATWFNAMENQLSFSCMTMREW